MISRPGKPWGLICIQHCYSDGGPVFEGASTQEARVHDGVEDLHRKRVGAPALIVYGLRRTTEKGEPVGLKIFNVEVAYIIIQGLNKHCKMSNNDKFY